MSFQCHEEQKVNAVMIGEHLRVINPNRRAVCGVELHIVIVSPDFTAKDPPWDLRPQQAVKSSAKASNRAIARFLACLR